MSEPERRVEAGVSVAKRPRAARAALPAILLLAFALRALYAFGPGERAFLDADGRE